MTLVRRKGTPFGWFIERRGASISVVVAAFAAAFAMEACSGQVMVERPGTEPDAVAPPAPPPLDAGKEPDADVPPTTCGVAIVDPKCQTIQPAPVAKDAIASFVKGTAIPLRCGATSKPVWDLQPLVDLFGTQKMFMMGEVHGSNEIGIVSSLVLEKLASRRLVNIVAFEMPMDYEAPLQRYVDTGVDAAAERLIDYLAPNMFGSILPRTARDLTEKGFPMKVGAVDIPTTVDLPARALQELANKLTTQKDTLLATLPARPAEPPSADDVRRVNAYFDLVMGKKTEVCAELSAAECDRLVAMTHALWASTLASDQNEGQSELWFSRREVVIYYNLRTKMAAPTDRMLLHMGAFHTNKFDASAGSRMSKEYELTKGQVFSVAPAYGDGSVIWYGQDQKLPGEPRTITGALTQTPKNPLFVSTTRPNLECLANPVGLENDSSVLGSGTLGELYDGYIHYGTLTSERRPKDATLARELTRPAGAASATEIGRAFQTFRSHVDRREREAFAKHGVMP